MCHGSSYFTGGTKALYWPTHRLHCLVVWQLVTVRLWRRCIRRRGGGGIIIAVKLPCHICHKVLIIGFGCIEHILVKVCFRIEVIVVDGLILEFQLRSQFAEDPIGSRTPNGPNGTTLATAATAAATTTTTATAATAATATPTCFIGVPVGVGLLVLGTPR